MEHFGKDISELNKAFDNALYHTAYQVRKDAANAIISSGDAGWKEINVHVGMLKYVLERTPFENTEAVLQFNTAVTEVACDLVLHSKFSLVEKIGMYANVVEIGSREFISPYNTDLVYKNLSAAKENGFFFTPPSLAIRMVIASIENSPKSDAVLDPAAGVGVFLAYHILLNPSIKNVFGIEIDQRTAHLGAKLLNYISLKTQKSVDISFIGTNFFDFFEDKKDHFRADLIIMNPPYGAVKTLASDLTDATTKAEMSDEDIRALESKIKKRTVENAARLRKQFCAYGMGRGTLEYSKLFMAATIEMLSDDGILVAITPSSWLGDETSTGFRDSVVIGGNIMELWLIPEKAKIFKGVNQPTVVSILSKKKSLSIKVYNPVLQVEDLEGVPEVLDLQSLVSVSGAKHKLPKCSEEELKLLLKVQQCGRIKHITNIINARGELDLTAYKDYVSAQKTEYRLIRGDHIQGSSLVSATDSEKAGYVLFDSFIEAIKNSEKSKYYLKPRIAIPQCSYLQKKKRIEAAIVPKGVVLANSCNFITLNDLERSREELFYYWMVLNSAVVEWQFRIFSYNNHVANKEIDELACIPYEDLEDGIKRSIEVMIDVEKQEQKFTSKMDALIASTYKLTDEEYGTILRSISDENIDNKLREFQTMIKNGTTIPQHQIPHLSELDKVMISYVEPGGNWTSIPEHIPSKRLDQIREMAKRRGMVRTTYYSRLKYTQPAYTISTYYNRPGNGANIHPWEDRTLSAREAARLQSFPDSFIFEGNESAIRTQIGNAVPPLLGYAIGKTIKEKVGRSLKFCDMFAGAGGLSYGMELAGFVGVAALELNKSAAATFAKNHSECINTIVGDINDTSIQSELFNTISSKIPEGDPWVLVGGPPCQGFSTAGYRDEKDIRNKLVDSYLKIIKQTQPTIVVMENVPGILSMKKGDVIKGVYQSLHNLGYVFHQSPWVLDAERYGVPQMRRRVIIVAAKKEEFLPSFPAPIFEKCLGRREQADQQLSLCLSAYPITVGEAFYGLPPLMEINEYFPKDAVIDQTYSKWCRGEITVETLFKERG